jgi:hypothetical protein
MKRYFIAITVLLAGVMALLPTISSSDDAPPKDVEFTYARIRYHMTQDAFFQREVPWHHDFPFGDEAFPAFLKEVTRVHTVSSAHEIVDIDSKDLFKYPFTYLCEPGFLDLNKKDVENFREYLDRGGFVLVDDFRGYRHLENLIRQMKKVYPDREIVPLDIRHQVFHSFYDIETLDVPPPYPSGGGVEFLGLSDEKGRLQMVINYNNDLSEFWEELDRAEIPMYLAANSLRFGVNYVMYALTH